MATAKKCDRCGKYYDSNEAYVTEHGGICYNEVMDEDGDVDSFIATTLERDWLE